MTIVDRYLIFLFLNTFLICFLSFSGLYIVIHLFSHLDDMALLSKTDGWPTLFYEFYVPRIAELFDKTAAILTLIAASFAVSLLHRRREMTAIEAAGITKARILRPIFVTALVVIGLTIANRELVIPQIKDSLVRTPQTWGDKGQIDLTTQEDFDSGVILRGDQLFVGEGRISEAEAQLPYPVSDKVPRIRSSMAFLEPATEQHPAGLRFVGIVQPEGLDRMPSVKSDSGQTMLFSSSEHSWLSPGQCFVACSFNVDQMAYGGQLANYQTTPEMIAELRKPRKWFGRGLQIGVHSRLLQPILDLTLLMLALPMVVGGVQRNVFVSAAICFWIVAAVQLTTMACHMLGASSLIRPAALAAWLPIVVFLPCAVVALRRLKR